MNELGFSGKGMEKHVGNNKSEFGVSGRKNIEGVQANVEGIV